jgi:ribose-phosphate pyrophosphokinase
MITIQITRDKAIFSDGDEAAKFIQFPDGQQQVTLCPWNFHGSKSNKYVVRAPMQGFRDLERIILLRQALLKYGIENVGLTVPYFLGARSDRAFEDMNVHYLRDVICPIINSQRFTFVEALDPHSDVLEACIPNFRRMESELNQFHNQARGLIREDLEYASYQVVAPDAGAVKRASRFSAFDSVVQAHKMRDSSGKIIQTQIKIPAGTNNMVIVDDICDGGGTFIALAEEIKRHEEYMRLFLVVTHGIFSQGFDKLRVFERIITTDSIPHTSTPNFVTVFPISIP